MNELRNKTVEELKAFIKEKNAEYEKHSQDLLRGKEKNVSLLKKLRREIAQANTVISEKKSEVTNA